MKKKKMLVIGAMERELNGLLDFYRCVNSEKLVQTYPVWHSTLERPIELIILQSFVGDNNAAISTTLALKKYDPDYVFKIGCIGGCSAGIHAGDIVLPLGYFSTTSWITRSSKDNCPISDASLWQSVFGEKPYQVNQKNLGNQPSFFRPNRDVCIRYKKFFESKGRDLVSCYIGSGNMWLFDSEYAKNTSYAQIPGQNRNHVWAADMESYAIAQTCYVFGKPFMGFYRVSDNHFENEPYVAGEVARLFDYNFVQIVDEFLQISVS